MSARSKLLMLSLTLALGGCAITPLIQVSTSGMAMQVKSKVPLVLAADYSPDGKSVVTGGSDGTARLWDLAGAREAMKFKELSRIILDAIYSPDGKAIAVSTHGVTIFTDHVTTLWDVATGSPIRKFTGNAGGKLSFSPDGRSVLGTSNTVVLRDVQSGAVIREFKGSEGKISPNGKYIAVLGVDIKGVIFTEYVFFVKLYDLATGKGLWSAAVPAGAVAFSPDSRQLLVARNESTHSGLGFDLATSFKLFETATGTQVKEFGHDNIPGGTFSLKFIYHTVTALAFAPDGKSFLSGDQGGQMQAQMRLLTEDDLIAAAAYVASLPRN